MIEVYVTKMYLFVKITQLGYVRFNVCTFYLKIKSTVKNKKFEGGIGNGRNR